MAEPSPKFLRKERSRPEYRPPRDNRLRRGNHRWTDDTPTSRRARQNPPAERERREQGGVVRPSPRPARRNDLTPGELQQVVEFSKRLVVITADEHKAHRQYGGHGHGIMDHRPGRRR